MKNLIILLTFVLTAQPSFAEVTSGGLNFETEQALAQAERIETRSSRDNLARDVVKLMARMKLQWYRLAMAYSEKRCDENPTARDERSCNMLQRGMERIRTAGGSLTTIAAAIPSIAGIGIAVQFSEFIRRNISESGRWKLIHRFTNIGVGGFASLIAVDHIRRLRRLPTSAKERLDQELQLAITALEVTEVSTFSGFRDLVGLDGDRLANVNLPGSDPEIDNGLERMIQRLSLTETYVQDINEIYTREFGY